MLIGDQVGPLGASSRTRVSTDRIPPFFLRSPDGRTRGLAREIGTHGYYRISRLQPNAQPAVFDNFICISKISKSRRVVVRGHISLPDSRPISLSNGAVPFTKICDDNHVEVNPSRDSVRAEHCHDPLTFEFHSKGITPTDGKGLDS